jgi:hypothetical protein
MYLTEPSRFIEYFGNYSQVSNLIKIGLSQNIMEFLLSNYFFHKVVDVFFRIINLFKPKGIKVRRLRIEKVDFINLQREHFLYDTKEIEALQFFLIGQGFCPPEYPDCKICWNRYSIIDKSGNLSAIIRNLGVQAGNYNWPASLHQIYAVHQNIIFCENCINSTIASKYVVNIPVWGRIFQNIKSEK